MVYIILMIRWIMLWIFYVIGYQTSALIPNRLPNGNILKYMSNKKNPSSDLKVINPERASLITRHWFDNIISDMVGSKVKQYTVNKVDCNYNDMHIVISINRLETYIQESYKSKGNHLYLAWMPNCIYGRNDVLFIIVASIDNVLKQFLIKHIVQSPYWDPEQIDSNELRLALMDQNIKNNCITTNFDYLYEHDLRFKLAWATWNLQYNANKLKEDETEDI